MGKEIDDLIFKIVDMTEEDAQGKLPVWVCQCLRYESYVFLAISGEEVLGIAVFQRDLDHNGQIALKYVTVAEDHRREGIATKLLNYSEQFFEENGVNVITCKTIGDTEYIGSAMPFLQHNSYKQLTVGGHLMNYDLRSLLNSNFYSQIEKMKVLYNRVAFLNQVDKKQRKAFEQKLAEKGNQINLQGLDHFFARYYLENGEITGFMNLKEVSENVLMLSDIYNESKADSKFVIPAMLASILRISSAVMPPETELFFQIFEDNVYNGIKTIFGEPKADEFIGEYIKRL